WRKLDCCGDAATGAFMKCSWTPNRSNKPRNGSRSIENSGKARSIGSPFIWKKPKAPRRNDKQLRPMCPICIANITFIAASATSSGGLSVLAMSRFYRRKQTNQIKGNQNETARDGTKNKSKTTRNRFGN